MNAFQPTSRVVVGLRPVPTCLRHRYGLFGRLRDIAREARKPADLCDDHGNIVGHTEGEPSFAAGLTILVGGLLVAGALAVMLPDGVWTALSWWGPC